MFAQKVLFAVVASLLIITCDTSDSLEGRYTHLKDPAMNTLMGFKSSEINHDYSVFFEIPTEYWAQKIQDENPIRVYAHYNNIAIVFEDVESFEEGIYFHLPLSSYLPQDTEILDFKEIEQDIYSFRMYK